MEVLGERWTFVVLREVFNGIRRFDDMRRHTGIPRQVLTNRLALLVEQDVLRREPYREAGQRERHEYRLTEKGFALFPVMVAVARWGDRYLADPTARPSSSSTATAGHRSRPTCAAPRGTRSTTPGVWWRGPAPAYDRQRQRRREASSSAAAITRGPSRSTSMSSSVTIPTLASSPSTSRTGRGDAAGSRLQLARRRDVRRAVGLARGEDRAAGGSAVERVPGADPVADVEVGPGRLDHRQGERLVAVGDREVGGAAHLLGQGAQHRSRRLAQHRLHRRRELQHAEPDVEPALPVAADQCVLLEGADQPVDHGAVDPDLGGELGDGQPARGRGQHRQHTQPAVEGLRRLGRHGGTVSVAPGRARHPTG